MANARFPSSPAPPLRAARSASIEPGVCNCPGCESPVDPLRAGHVAILEGRFEYFCHPRCKQLYLEARGRPPEEDVPTARPPEVAHVISAHNDLPAGRAAREGGAYAAPPSGPYLDQEEPV